METLSLFDVMSLIQTHNPSKFVILNYEEPSYILCDKLEDKIPKWISVETENVKGKDFLVISSNFVYYVLLTDQTQKYFST